MKEYVGAFYSKRDQKGRLVFPAAFKAVATANAVEEGTGCEPLQFVVKKDLFMPCLTFYSYAEWGRQSSLVREKLGVIDLNSKKSALWRAFTSDRAIVSPDDTSGRILIPKLLLDKIGLTTEALFLGNDYRIELWDKEVYEKHKTSEEEFVALAEEFL